MATLTTPYTFVNVTPAVAAEVNANFLAVKTFVELLAAGTNLDASAIIYSHLAAATVTAITALNAADGDQNVLATQVFS